MHNVFHLSLLRIHIANNDCLFPNRSEEQIPDIGGTRQEWAVEKILAHQGSHSDTTFEVQWASGDWLWVPYHNLECLHPLKEYFEVLGVDGIENLWGVSEASPGNDPQVSLGHIKFAVPCSTHHIKPRSLHHPTPSSPAPRSTKDLHTSTPTSSHPCMHLRSHTCHSAPAPGPSAVRSHCQCHSECTKPATCLQAPHLKPMPAAVKSCMCTSYPHGCSHHLKCPQCPTHCPCRAPDCVLSSFHIQPCLHYCLQTSHPRHSPHVHMPPKCTQPIRTLHRAGPAPTHSGWMV